MPSALCYSAPPTCKLALALGVLTTLLLLADPAAANTAGNAPHAKTARARTTTPRTKVDSIQTTVLRYTRLLSLPHFARNEFRITEKPAPATTEDAQLRCFATSATDTFSGEKVAPCLGLSRDNERPGAIQFRFDVALKSIGAPKDIFLGQCSSGSNDPACKVIGEAQAEQERLADALNRQRHPVATLGLALSF
ncbi:MAG: hypothetical protein JWM03_1390 [Rhodocyclales bacterium]|nr:hypothetical protein [Rhodocyclales bacterium]MDB5888518.1 hypothetical protein [Rhodocyclales bacterium]